MSLASEVLDFFRAQWADRLVDSCIIKEQTGTSFNETTGQIDPTYTTRYGPGVPDPADTGACLVRPGTASDAEFGEQQAELYEYTVLVPHTVTGLKPGLQVDIASTHDGDLDGLQLVVRNVGKDTYRTVRPLGCEENQSD